MRILQSVVALLAAATLEAATLESTISFVDGKNLLENPGCGYAGGRWCEPRVSGDVTVREFAIDRSKPRRTAGVVEFDITAELLSSIPEPDGGAASFVFLSDSWRPVPYGYTGDGWLRLGGVEVSEGQSVRLKVVLSPGKVEYWLDGVALTDDAGRSVFPAAAPVGASPSLSLAGAKPVDIGFVATLESLGPEPLTLRLR